MENKEKKNISGDRVTTIFALLFIAIISWVSVYYYLKHNPEHLLVFDDSYITLKFASNFFRYGNITYDGNSFFAGATSPLHIIFIALCSLFLDIETASLAVGIIFFILSSFLVYLWILAIYNNKIVALLAGILMSTNGWLIFDALNGLETTTFICFSLLTFYLYYLYEEKPRYVVPLFLSILTRPEGWFIAFALWLWQIIKFSTLRDKQVLNNLFISLGIFTLFITPYFLLSLHFTESLLPGTAFAKASFFAEGSMPLGNKIGFFKNRLLPFYLSLLYPFPLLIFPIIACARKVIFLSYLWIYCIIFYVTYFFLFPGAIQHYWYRYQHIFIPLFIIGLAGGTYKLTNICKQKFLKTAMAMVICLCLAYNQSVSFQHVRNIYVNQIDSIKNTLFNLAFWIKNNTPEDSLIALHDIGVVGYYSERQLLDLVGLTDREIKSLYWNSQTRIPVPFYERRVIDFLKERQPDYLVLFPEWDRFFNLLQPPNKKHFQLIHTTLPLYPTELRYHVYKCNWKP